MPRLSRTRRQKSGLAFCRVAMQSLLLLVLLNGVVTCDMAKAMLLGTCGGNSGETVMEVGSTRGSASARQVPWAATARVNRASGARGPLSLRLADAEGRSN